MINILVIEDDVSIREIINYNLSNKFSVLTADNAEEGLEICQEDVRDSLAGSTSPAARRYDVRMAMKHL